MSQGWSEAEKYTLLVKIIGQLTEGGAKINLAALDMPGRTPKALSHVVTNIKAQAAEWSSGQGNSGQPAATPQSKKRGRKVKDDDDEDGGDDTPMPKKRAKPTPKTPKTPKTKKAKVEQYSDDNDHEGAATNTAAVPGAAGVPADPFTGQTPVKDEV